MALALKAGNIKSWKVRDTLARLYDRFVVENPSLSGWPSYEGEEDDPDEIVVSPDTLLPLVGGDVDVRVRFRAAVANAHLFSLAQKTERDPNQVYAGIKYHYAVDLDEYVASSFSLVRCSMCVQL